MKAALYILYFLTLCVHPLTADPSNLVDTMNHILTQPGWLDVLSLKDIQIYVKWMEGDNRILTVKDLVTTDEDGQIVNEDNVDCKIRQAHQFLSCEYAYELLNIYKLNIGALHQCKRFQDPSESLKCICMFLDMIKKIDELVVLMQGILSCIYDLSSTTTFDKDVSEAMEEFKTYYDNPNFDRTSINKEIHEEMIESTIKNMAKTLKGLREFYDNSCRPRFVDGGDVVKKLEDRYPLAFEVLEIISTWLGIFVRVNTKYYRLFGFEHDSNLKKTSIKQQPATNFVKNV